MKRIEFLFLIALAGCIVISCDKSTSETTVPEDEIILPGESSRASTDNTKGNEQFPDEVFKQYCLDNFDENKDGAIDEEEAAKVEKIVVNGLAVRSLKGVERFKNLKQLHCNGYRDEEDFKNYVEIGELDVSGLGELEYLDCGHNNLVSLNVKSNTKLKTLVCSQNKIASLDVSGNNKLEYLLAYQNELTGSFDLGEKAGLKILAAGNNHLTSLDVTGCPKLVELRCNENELGELDVTRNPTLVALYCNKNQLTTLDFSNSGKLEILNCSENRIKELDMTATDLVSNSVPHPFVCMPMETLQTVILKKEWKYRRNLTTDLPGTTKVEWR